MPEGHTIHRAARDHRRILAGRSLRVSSPQGRFAAGADHLDGRVCLDVEAFGKHLVYRFEGESYLHVHLGLFGRIRKRKFPPPEPVGAVRVRLEGDTHLVDINGPAICETLDGDGFQTLTGRIGPDVLRADADPERAFRRISRSRTSIGRLIMNQSVMAGIGNIYRTEILWRQRIHPDRPGREITREAFDAIWSDAVHLLAIGVRRNAIVTVDDAPPGRGRYRERSTSSTRIAARTATDRYGGWRSTHAAPLPARRASPRLEAASGLSKARHSSPDARPYSLQ